jgi:hypothetical protein
MKAEKTGAARASRNDIRIVWGAAAIGRVVNLSPRQAFYLLEKGLLPAQKVGARWCADERALQAHFEGEGNIDA